MTATRAVFAFDMLHPFALAAQRVAGFALGVATCLFGWGVLDGKVLPRWLGTAGVAAGGIALDPSEASANIIGLSKKAMERLGNITGKYEKYATEYPANQPRPLVMSKETEEVVPGVRALSKEAERLREANKVYYAKNPTPEAEQFAKDRAFVDKMLTAQGYEKYFDPAKRFDVNPKNYPTETFTLTHPETNPAKAETAAKYEALYGSEDAQKRLIRGYNEGLLLPNSPDWYLMGQLEKEYTSELGAREGRQRFGQEFGGGMAATTGGQTPMANFLMQQYLTHLDATGQKLPLFSWQMAVPIGGRYAQGNLGQFRNFSESNYTPFGPLNPKRHDFQYAFLGHKVPVIDEQMSGAIVPKMTMPEFYGPASQTVYNAAETAGADPRRFQEVTWAGLKKLLTEARGQQFNYEGPMIEHPNRAIARTSILTGADPDTIVRQGLVRKIMPVFGGAGLAVPSLTDLLSRQPVETVY